MNRWFLYPISILFIFIITISLLIGEDKAWVDCSNEEDLYHYINEGWKVDKVLKDGDINFGKDGTKYLMQYRWRCTFRDAYYVCKLLWPYAHTKLPKIQQVIEHYAKDVVMNGKVVSLEQYKQLMNLEG